MNDQDESSVLHGVYVGEGDEVKASYRPPKNELAPPPPPPPPPSKKDK